MANKRVVKGSKVSEKKINPKNYLYAFLILAGSIIIAFYIFSWYRVKQEEKLMVSYLLSSKTIESKIDNLDSISQILEETPSSYFIYFGYTKDKDVYNLETNLKRVIDKYKLNDSFYYVDVTEMMDDKDLIDNINKKLNIKLENVPAIIYVNNKEIKDSDILDGVNETMLKSSDLEKLLDVYDYDIFL